ncbi:MAG: hypothetical protein EA403_07135 [Spirochaetaceae bacterium]|nr:MAG: hypothetical protein EA403_07135 [Spirochaetaceae bacterium]
MDIKTMVALARRVVGSYDLHERCGFPHGVAVPNRDAAAQIVEDMIASSNFLVFVSLLIEVNQHGFVGRKIPIRGLDQIVSEVMDAGMVYDAETHAFVEVSGRRQTSNWGVIRDGDVHTFGFLRFDIVGNSRLVREYDESVVMKAYGDLREIIHAVIERRNGRLWSWEGDGGLAAFFTDEVDSAAVLSGMEILSELVLYNALQCPLDEPLRLRLAVHSGTSEYRSNVSDIQSATIKKVYQIEAHHTQPNSLTVSDTVFYSLDPLIEPWFVSVGSDGDTACFRYAVTFET